MYQICLRVCTEPFLGASAKQLPEAVISLMLIRPFLCMEKRDSNRKDICNISYLGLLLKSLNTF